MKNYKIVPVLLACLLPLSACKTEAVSTEVESTPTSTTVTTVSTVVEDSSGMFTERDLEVGYDEDNSTKIALEGTSASYDGSGVVVDGATITITKEGTYILSGTLTDGMVIVEVDDSEKVQLVLDGVTITNSTSCAIYVKNADKVFITTTNGSVNTLENGGTYEAIDENNIDAVIFAKDDITLNGLGTLIINANAGHGIVSKDDLKLTSGTYEINAASHALSGKDSVRIASGTYVLNAGKDGIHSENSDDESAGFIYIGNGTFTINADGDGIDGQVYVQVEGGTFDIQANGVTSTDTSTKGIKASGDVLLNGGTFNISSSDDAIHSNSNVTVNDGTYTISASDDGIHADSDVVINDGTVTITNSYEGIEGLTITINGGDISVTASDDGLNAAGGNDSSGFGFNDMFASTDGAYVSITGGTLYVNAYGDGLDSNGTLSISGGTIYVAGPEDNGNGALDYDGTASITGGTIIAVGGSGMAENFTEASQGSIMVNMNGSAGSVITLTDSEGNVIVSWTSTKSFQNIVISSPSIVQGGTYTLSVDGSSTTITMDSLIYGSGMGMGGMQGGMGGMQGGPGGGMGNPPGGH